MSGRGLALATLIGVLGTCALGACLEAKRGSILPGATLETGADVTDTSDAPTPDADATGPLQDTGEQIIAAQLDGLRWELPCYRWVSDTVCNTANSVSDSTVLQGEPDTTYRITVRVRGVVEETAYTGGTFDGHFQSGGQPVPDDWNTYRLAVSSPQQSIYLNRGTTGLYHCVALDYRFTFDATGGATITFDGEVYDAQQIVNVGLDGEPLRIPDVDPWPGAFDGQFLQLDVVAIEAL